MPLGFSCKPTFSRTTSDPCGEIGGVGPHGNGDLVLLLAHQAKLELDTSRRALGKHLAQLDLAAQTGE